MQVIKDKQVIEDAWQFLDEAALAAGLPSGDIIVPYAYWQAHEAELLARESRLGVCINGEHDTAEVAVKSRHFALIAVDFPGFKDGRAYSHARILRDHYDYTGDIRAVGDVLRDQLYYMQRCGISSFQVRADKDMEDALQGLTAFSASYQTAADRAVPVCKLR